MSLCRNVGTQVDLLKPLATIVQPHRNAWGNVNTPNRRPRQRPNRHWDPKNKGLRMAKQMIINLPDIDAHRKLDKTGDVLKMREHLKKQGIFPTNPSREHAVYIASTSDVLDSFIPPEGEGKASIFSLKGAKSSGYDPAKSKGKTFRAVRVIRKFDPEFEPKHFVDDAQDLYIDVHKALSEKKTKELHELVTEDMYPKIMNNMDRVTIYWDFIKSLEPPRVVHVRQGDILAKDNTFAQVTVRFFSQQILAVYDRFGRLIHGHPHVAKDVLEYVVFEKHIANMYGKWRMHAKIVPEWLEKDRPEGFITHILDKRNMEEIKESAPVVEDTENISEKEEKDVVYDEYGKPAKRRKELESE